MSPRVARRHRHLLGQRVRPGRGASRLGVGAQRHLREGHGLSAALGHRAPAQRDARGQGQLHHRLGLALVPGHLAPCGSVALRLGTEEVEARGGGQPQRAVLSRRSLTRATPRGLARAVLRPLQPGPYPRSWHGRARGPHPHHEAAIRQRRGHLERWCGARRGAGRRGASGARARGGPGAHGRRAGSLSQSGAEPQQEERRHREGRGHDEREEGTLAHGLLRGDGRHPWVRLPVKGAHAEIQAQCGVGAGA